MAFGGVFSPVFRPAFDLAGAAATPPASNWWEAGGAPTPLVVYQPKGAASLAASYVNLVNPGTYDAAPGNAPGWSSGTGWVFSGAEYLGTGLSQGLHTWLVYFANAVSNGFAFGAEYQKAAPRWYGNILVQSRSGQPFYGGGDMTSGVLCLAGDYAVYKDGTLLASGSPGGTTPRTGEYYVGANNASGPQSNFIGDILAIAIWNSVLTADEVAAVCAAALI